MPEVKQKFATPKCVVIPVDREPACELGILEAMLKQIRASDCEHCLDVLHTLGKAAEERGYALP